MKQETFYCPHCNRHKPGHRQSPQKRRGHSICLTCVDDINARNQAILEEQQIAQARALT